MYWINIWWHFKATNANLSITRNLNTGKKLRQKQSHPDKEPSRANKIQIVGDVIRINYNKPSVFRVYK